jgi:site-specific DNA-adenine methylase
MTAYHGGKRRQAKWLSDTMLLYLKENECKQDTYCEPFMGMASVLHEIVKSKHFNKYKASDINGSVVCLFRDFDTVLPASCSYDEYMNLKHSSHSSGTKAMVGFGCSFRGVYFRTYYPELAARLPVVRERVYSMRRVFDEAGVEFYCSDYSKWTEQTNSVMFCDPPYFHKSSTMNQFYEESNKPILYFDSLKFFEWCTEMSFKNNIVFVTEYIDLPETHFVKLKEKKKTKLYVVKKQ